VGGLLGGESHCINEVAGFSSSRGLTAWNQGYHLALALDLHTLEQEFIT
jgi:hypothetical protein